MSPHATREAIVGLLESSLHATRKLESRRLDDPRITPLTPVERLVIQHIEHHPGDSLQHLAEAVNLQRSNASAVVRRLIDLDLVQRSCDESDARRVSLTITPAARRHIDIIHGQWWEQLRDAELDADEVATARRVIQQIDAWISEH